MKYDDKKMLEPRLLVEVKVSTKLNEMLGFAKELEEAGISNGDLTKKLETKIQARNLSTALLPKEKKTTNKQDTELTRKRFKTLNTRENADF
ncbi:hypothetical protein OO184_02555 [Photorhabdus sp. APURE]|uniref:hypothetical protein n=1 Tax=Photorhabdus aballayi TaxID=2991723 RepID=UPI00223E894A|nr:hypothetical protein [Photorhabdus aballayi]MCW7546859.1 hypothetical protein [Photorhabdus aballayi]